MAEPPFPIKHTWVFFDAVGARWEEVYWIGGINAKASLNSVTQAAVAARLAFLAPSAKLRMIQANEYQGNRTTFERIYNLGGAKDTGVDPDPDLSSSAVVYLLKGETSGRRLIWFRGLPDAAITFTLAGDPALLPKTQKYIEAWLSVAEDIHYSIKMRARQNAGANTEKRQVTNLNGAARPGSAVLTLEDATGYVPGDRVRVNDFDPKQLPGLNGEYTVRDVTGLTITVEYRTPQIQNYGDVGGYSRRIPPLPLVNIDASRCQFSHLGSHQTKTDFTRSRGARRARRIRRLA